MSDEYSPGHIISASCPLAHVINNEKKSLFCDYCLLTSENLRKCSNCKHMFYCDALCQRKDWKRHKYECDIYSQNYLKIERNLDRFLLRLFLFLKNNPTAITKSEKLQFDKTTERCFEDLMTHSNILEIEPKHKSTFAGICQRFNECNIEFDQPTLFEYFCKICVNSFSVLDVNLNEIGTAIYIGESAFDHSCLPNAAPVFSGMYLEIRALKEITAGEKITINYVDLKSDQDKRQRQLQEQYFFNCNCERCNSNFDNEFDSKNLNEMNAKMDEYIEEEEYQKAFQIGQQTIDLFKQVYGGYHPDLSVQLMRVLKLRLYISGDLDNEGIQLVTLTNKHIQITHGSNHELLKVYRSVLNLD